MNWGKVSMNAVKLYRAATTTLKTGAKYVTQETKSVIKNHTAIGRRFRDGIQHAKDAVKNRMKLPSDNTGSMVEKTKVLVTQKGEQAIANLQNDKEFMDLFERYTATRSALNGPEQLQRRTEIGNVLKEGVVKSFLTRTPLRSNLSKMDNEKFFQEIIETMGVGPTKFAQIISNNPKAMAQIEENFGPKLVQAMKNTKSGCYPTRTIEEAQALINKAFPNQNIVIKPNTNAKVASIGETYFVNRADGSEAVVKMLKNGVTKEQLQMEEQIMNRMAQEFIESPKELTKVRGQLKTLYEDWGKELDFTEEFANNKLLSQGAKRFKVAKITGISEDASCIVMDKASGVKMDELIEMLKFYKSNPTQFETKYAKEIERNPWLVNPDKVAKELPNTVLKSFDEQFMLMKKGGQSVMHGDPHTGNFFITQNKKGKLIPEFIDTGSCVKRTGKQIKDDISFFSNYFVGNSRGIAEYFVKQCPHSQANIEQITQAITKDIQTQIFGKTQNICKFSDVQATITDILEKHGLQMSTESATAMKAQMQFFSAVSEAGKLTGQPVDILTVIKDIPQAVWGMAKNGTNPWSAIKDACKFAFHNQKQAVGTAYQFKIKDIDSVLKADGTLAAVV